MGLHSAISDRHLKSHLSHSRLSDKPSFPAKIFHSWTQSKGKFILESLSQIFLQPMSSAGEIKAIASLDIK